jgi:hypothetical protein
VSHSARTCAGNPGISGGRTGFPPVTGTINDRYRHDPAIPVPISSLLPLHPVRSGALFAVVASMHGSSRVTGILPHKPGEHAPAVIPGVKTV